MTVEEDGCVVVRVAGEVEEVGGVVVVVVVAVIAAVDETLTVVSAVVAVVTGKAVGPVFVAVAVVPGFLHDGANPIEARVMPPITIPAFSKNSLRLRASRELFFSLRISFTSIAGLVPRLDAGNYNIEFEVRLPSENPH